MVNYKNGRVRYRNDCLGSLYFDWKNYSSINRPVIYIGGQMEHRLHLLEKSGITFDSSRTFFDGNWSYEYSISINNKGSINSINFASSLSTCIEKAGLKDVDIVTYSYGGLIGLSLTNYPFVHKVIAIHPPILGTPLADLKCLKHNMQKFAFDQKIIATFISNIINSKYGFQRENKEGIYNNNFSNVDLSKYYVVGSGINYEEETNVLMKKIYEMIYLLTEKESDGIVLFSPKELQKLGIQYFVENEWRNHFNGSEIENIEKAYTMSLKK